METQPITLKEKPAVEGLRVRYGHSLASHAFASLYLWREQMGLSLLLTPDMFTARCLWQGENAWFFPCGGERAVADFVAARGYGAMNDHTRRNLLYIVWHSLYHHRPTRPFCRADVEAACLRCWKGEQP